MCLVLRPPHAAVCAIEPMRRVASAAPAWACPIPILPDPHTFGQRSAERVFFRRNRPPAPRVSEKAVAAAAALLPTLSHLSAAGRRAKGARPSVRAGGRALTATSHHNASYIRSAIAILSQIGRIIPTEENLPAATTLSLKLSSRVAMRAAENLSLTVSKT